jgi:DNA-binding winged helix-turn-helix (wHTH) protein
MASAVAFAQRDDNLIEAARTMVRAASDALPVLGDEGRLIGTITCRDIVVSAVATGRDPRSTKVQEVMSSETNYCFEDEEADRVAQTLARLHIGKLSVVDRNKRLVGVARPRIETVVSQSPHTRVTVLRVGPLTLDLIERKAKRGEREVELLPREFKLLEYFMGRPDQLVTREMLLKDVWKYRVELETNVVDVHIGKLRRKLTLPQETQLLINVRGAGFVLHSIHEQSTIFEMEPSRTGVFWARREDQASAVKVPTDRIVPP